MNEGEVGGLGKVVQICEYVLRIYVKMFIRVEFSFRTIFLSRLVLALKGAGS